ncbi:MAG: hypothetical protein ACOC0N_12105 [Chroococcales cyanobacterium]
MKLSNLLAGALILSHSFILTANARPIAVLQNGDEVFATSGLGTNTPTVITLRSRRNNCGQSYGTPAYSSCIQDGGMIRSVWNINCNQLLVTISNEFGTSTNQLFPDLSSATVGNAEYTRYVVYEYACPAN